MSSFMIKSIAAFTMCISHLYYVIPNASYYYLYIGSISFPLFAFQASIGYCHTKDLKKYCLRLFLFALISQIPFMLLFQKNELNIFFTLLLGIISLYVWDKSASKIYKCISILFFSVLAQLIHCDYGAFGVLIIYIFYAFRNKHFFMNILFIFLAIINFIPALIKSNFYYPNILLLVFTCIPLIFIHFFNGNKGKNMKYFLYIFYPLHITLFYVIKLFLMF